MDKKEERINNIIDTAIHNGSIDAIRMVVNDYKDYLTDEIKEKVIGAIADLTSYSITSPYKIRELVRDIYFVNERIIAEWIIKNQKVKHAYKFLCLYIDKFNEGSIDFNYEGLKNTIFDGGDIYYINDLYNKILQPEERELEKQRYDDIKLSKTIEMKNTILCDHSLCQRNPVDIYDFVNCYRDVLTEVDKKMLIEYMKKVIHVTYGYLSPKYGVTYNNKFEDRLNSFIIEPLIKFIAEYLDNDAGYFKEEILMFSELQFISKFMHFENIDTEAFVSSALDNHGSIDSLFKFYYKQKDNIEFKKFADIVMRDTDSYDYIATLHRMANDEEKKYIEESYYNQSETNKIFHLVARFECQFYTTIQIEKRIIELGEYPTIRIFGLFTKEDFDHKLWLDFVAEKGNVRQIIKYLKEIINDSDLEIDINEKIKMILLREDIDKAFFLSQLSNFDNISLIRLEYEIYETENDEYINAFKNDLNFHLRILEQVTSYYIDDINEFIIPKNIKDRQKTKKNY